jgi:hypothetical protein
MRHLAKNFSSTLVSIVVLLISGFTFAQDQSKGGQTSRIKQDVAVSVPDLSDIIPEAAKLSGELVILENRVRDVLDVSELEKKFARVKENLKGPTAQLKQMKDSKDIRINKLVEHMEVIEQEKELFEETSRPLREAIHQFGTWRNAWQAEKQRWNEWQPILSANRSSGFNCKTGSRCLDIYRIFGGNLI